MIRVTRYWAPKVEKNLKRESTFISATNSFGAIFESKNDLISATVLFRSCNPSHASMLKTGEKTSDHLALINEQLPRKACPILLSHVKRSQQEDRSSPRQRETS